MTGPGWESRLARLDLGPSDDPEALTLELYVVDSLDKHVDRQRLLNERELPDPPYWALPWIGARAIARRLLANPPRDGIEVLDLGCGLGLAGVAAGLCGSSVTFADYAPECFAFVEASARHHGLKNWQLREVDFCHDRLPTSYDLVLAADVVYEPESYRPLAEFLDAQTAQDGTVLLTETLRADAGLCLGHLRELGFVDQPSAQWVLEDGRRERTWLHELRRR